MKLKTTEYDEHKEEQFVNNNNSEGDTSATQTICSDGSIHIPM